MRAVLLLLTLTLGAGCKRGAKDTAESAPDDRANVKAVPVPVPTPQAVPKKGGAKNPEPEARKDEPAAPQKPEIGRKPDPAPIQQDGRGDSKKPWVTGVIGELAKPAPGVLPNPQPAVPPPPVPAPPVGRVPNPVVPVPPLAPPGNNPRAAAKRLVAMADMRDLQVFIDTASAVDGKMPSAADILTALKDARSPVFNMVVNESITLTGIRQREGIWAFETAAYLNGGLAVSQNGVERLTADELRKRLGK